MKLSITLSPRLKVEGGMTHLRTRTLTVNIGDGADVEATLDAMGKLAAQMWPPAPGTTAPAARRLQGGGENA